MKNGKLLIIECVPKNQKKNESLILQEFLKMISLRKEVWSKRGSSKGELVNYLGSKKDLGDFGFVHLSGHGDGDGCTFLTPKGALVPENFPEGCFGGKTVTFSACSLGQRAFAQPFLERTKAKCVIAPRRKVDFDDAAMWFLHFYHQVFGYGVTPRTAYDRTESALAHVRGDFRLWPQQET